MRLAVDTNILFSALLGGRISRVFARAVVNLELHTTSTTVEELGRHMDRITRYSALSAETLRTALNEILTEDVVVHDTAEIPEVVKERAKRLVAGVDPDDWPFVALAMFLGVPLWTGDKALIRRGLETGEYIAVDTDGVEMLLNGAGLERVLERMRGRYLG